MAREENLESSAQEISARQEAAILEQSLVEQEYRRQFSQIRRLPRILPGSLVANNNEAALADQALDEDQIAEEEEDAATGAKNMSRQLRAARQSQQKAELKKKVEEEVVKRAQNLARTFKIAKIGSAATLIGLVITYVLMSIQFIGGNWLGSPNIPKLAVWELVLWGLLTAILLFIMIMAFMVVILLLIVALGPLAALLAFGLELTSMIF